MNCPACRNAVPAGAERCPECGAHVAPPVEGALAPDPAHGRAEPLREIPGLKKKERSWRDEVRDRVRDRRRDRGGEDLPLFRDDEEAALEADSPEAPAPRPERPREVEAEPAARELEIRDPRGPRVIDDDLPLRGSDTSLEGTLVEAERPAPSAAERDPLAVAEERARERPAAWGLGEDEPEPNARPVERPAFVRERAQAAAIDLLLIGSIWAVVVYFSGRAARVGFLGLLPTWPYLGGYLALFGLLYAACFSGATGQTLGKMVTGLHVLGPEDKPPGFPRAAARAFAGAIGVLAAGAGVLPMLFDPARRALHDRILRTRVVRR